METNESIRKKEQHEAERNAKRTERSPGKKRVLESIKEPGSIVKKVNQMQSGFLMDRNGSQDSISD